MFGGGGEGGGGRGRQMDEFWAHRNSNFSQGGKQGRKVNFVSAVTRVNHPKSTWAN